MAHRFYPVPKCWEGDGWYAVAECTQCSNHPLCQKHAGNPYPKNATSHNSIGKGYAYLNLEDPSVRGIRIWVSLTANDKILAEYGERNVCRECHIKNTRAEHARILQSLSLPQLEAMTLFEFALFMLFSGYHFSLQAMQIPEILNLTSQHIIQGWLKFAEQEQVAPETTVVIESQTKRKQSSSAERSGWRFLTEYTEYKDYAAGDDWTVDYFSWVFITPHGHAYQPSELMKVMKGKEDYAPYRTRNVPSPWPEDDPHPPGSMYNKSLMLFYGVAKRIAAIRGITWRWRIPYLSEGIPPFCE